MIRGTVDPTGAKSHFRDLAARLTDLTPGMRAVEVLVTRIVRDRFDSSTDPFGQKWAELYPRPETVGRRPLAALQNTISGFSNATQAITETDHQFASILHFGATTKPHEIRPRPRAGGKPGFLVWTEIDGTVNVRRRVWHPGSVIPARKFMELGPTEEPQVVKVLEDHVLRILEQAGERAGA